MSRIRIEVTAEDIARGERYSGLSCPIALAARRACAAIDGCPRPCGVAHARIAFDNDGVALLPREATDFIRDFDDGLAVDPFAFDLEGA